MASEFSTQVTASITRYRVTNTHNSKKQRKTIHKRVEGKPKTLEINMKKGTTTTITTKLKINKSKTTNTKHVRVSFSVVDMIPNAAHTPYRYTDECYIVKGVSFNHILTCKCIVYNVVIFESYLL